MTGSETPARRRDGFGGPLAWVLAVLLLATLAVQAWAAWQRDLAAPTPPGVGTGSLISVTLLGGQIYYGNVVAANGHQVSLENVYYVQSEVDAAGGARNNRLVNRQRADWHAPSRMTIAADKIVMIEAVGAGSRLQQLMEQDKAAAGRPAAP